MSRIISSRYFPYLVFLFFWMVTIVLYRSTTQAGFVMDFIGWQIRFENGNFGDIIHCFGYPGLHQVFHLFFYSFYSLFHTEGLPWFLLFSSFHAFNGFFLFYVFSRIFQRFGLEQPSLIAFFGSLMFLVLPYQTDVVVWKVCLHYLATSFLLLYGIWSAFRYMDSGAKKFIWHTHIAFLLSLFFLEVSFVTPFVILAVILSYSFAPNLTAGNGFKQNFTRLFLPQVGILGFYFLLTRLVLGQWIGHYGAEEHLHFPLKEVFATAYKYLAKYSLFARYFEHDAKEALFTQIGKAPITWSITGIFILTFLFAIAFYKKLSVRIRLSGLLLILFFLCIAPVSNLYFYTIDFISNDRYGYHASMFLMMMLALAIFRLSPKWRYFILGLWLFISILLLEKTTKIWSEGSRVYYSLLNDFKWYESDSIVVLAIADNYDGMYMFRTVQDPSALPEALKYSHGRDFSGKVFDVVQFNMNGMQDGVSVSQEGFDKLRVTFRQWGNWWWQNGIGAQSGENELFRYELEGQSYLLTFKIPVSGLTTLIYQDGMQWKEFKWESG